MATWIIGGLVFAGIGLAIYRLYQNNKKGSACGCGNCKD